MLSFSIGTAVLAAILAAGLTWPTFPTPLSLAARHERRADLALQGDSSRPADFERAARENERTLAAAPMTATAWLRAAYIRQQVSGALDAESLRYIENSYLAAPLGPGVSPWRLLFVFENWPSMNPAIRSAALAELRLFSSQSRRNRALANAIQNPAGRLAAKLAVRTTQRNAAASRRQQMLKSTALSHGHTHDI